MKVDAQVYQGRWFIIDELPEVFPCSATYPLQYWLATRLAVDFCDERIIKLVQHMDKYLIRSGDYAEY
jgi:hypothetical protein